MRVNLVIGYKPCLKIIKNQVITMVFLIIGFSMASESTFAYDGDVDYNAPYLTVDPETGKLVTIDPKTQTTTPHETAGNTITSITPNATTSITPASEDRLIEMSQEGIVIALLLFGYVLFSFHRKKQATTLKSDIENG